MSRRMTVGVFGVTLAMLAIGLALLALVPADRARAGTTLGDAAPMLPLLLSSAAVGLLIGWNRPGNRTGRLLSLLGAAAALQLLLAGYAAFGLFREQPLPGAILAAWIFSWSGGVVGLFGYLLLFEFPNGVPDLRRARFGIAIGVTSTALFGIALAFIPGPLFNMTGVQNPFGLAGQEAVAVALAAIAGATFFLTIGLAASALRERYRRADHRERLQIKWFVAGMVFATAVSTLSIGLALVDFGLAKIFLSLAVSALPIAVAIAILREHLYDIDVLINRALVYGATTAGIAVAFFAAIVVLQTLLRPFTGGSEIAVAASTLASVALAQPLRGRMQSFVDRRFYRSRYDAARTLDAFSVRLRDEVDLNAVRAELVSAVRDTVQPAHATVWLRERIR